ncbi:HNH endonuclease signature motif containing protein [Frankia nepalensis]|uniref:HNH endonuclease signature motif containing protein n=1 Tax=Frankia nepalensis TaxID=1836974 RepID=UPI00288A1DA1|nr:DUF222 domain-containing protein [Frankia nepalensis]
MSVAPDSWLVAMHMITMTASEQPSEPAAGLAVDVEAAELAALEREIVAWAGRLAAATCGWLVLVAAFDRRGGWRGQGFASCAHWLAWRCGVAVRTAREHLAVGHALETLPAVRAAFAAGRLSYSKVRAVARVAEPDSERAWLNHAQCCTAAQLERLAATCERLSGDHPAQRAGRRVSWRTERDGTLRLSAVLPADEGAQLVAAIDAARASLADTSPLPAAGEPDRPPADGEIVAAPRDRRADADALVALAAGFLHRPAPGLLLPSHTVTVHVDVDTLLRADQPAAGPDQPDGAGGPVAAADDTDEARGPSTRDDAGPAPAGVHRRLFRADVEPGIGLSAGVLRRLGCDGLLRALLSDADGNPLYLGRRRRFPSRRLRDAVFARDHGMCTYPACEHTRWLHIHHLAEWVADEGATDIDLLTLLCGTHHRTVHDEGITLERGPDGTIIAILPDGRVLRPAPPVDPGPRATEILAATTADLDDDAISTRDGGRLHLSDSVLVLTQHRWNPAARASRGERAVEDLPRVEDLPAPAQPADGGDPESPRPGGHRERPPTRHPHHSRRPVTGGRGARSDKRRSAARRYRG